MTFRRYWDHTFLLHWTTAAECLLIGGLLQAFPSAYAQCAWWGQWILKTETDISTQGQQRQDVRGQNWAVLVIRVKLKQDRSGCQGRTRREESSVCTGVMLLCSVKLSLETLWAYYANQTFLSGEFVRYNNIKIKSLCLYFQRRTIETSCISVGVRNHPTYSQYEKYIQGNNCS